MTLTDQLRQLREQRQLRDRAKEEYDVLKAECDELEQRVFEAMESEDVGSMRVGDNNFVRAATIYGQVADRAAFIEWAEAEMPELIEPKERKALVNEIVRERIDSGESLPPGLNFYAKQYISQRTA